MELFFTIFQNSTMLFFFCLCALSIPIYSSWKEPWRAQLMLALVDITTLVFHPCDRQNLSSSCI